MAIKPLLINRQDYQLFLAGQKTCTSRYGSRLDEFPVGGVKSFQVNDDSGEASDIVIVDAYVKTLKEMTEEEANAIGNYSRAEGLEDFTEVYTKLGRDVCDTTPVTFVWFRAAGASA